MKYVICSSFCLILVASSGDSLIAAPPSITPVVLTRQSATPSTGSVFQFIDTFYSLDQRGGVTFRANESVASGTLVAGFWYSDGTNRRAIARSGDAVPGIDGVSLLGLPGAMVRLEDGGFVYAATLAGVGTSSVNDYAIISSSPVGERAVLFREGQSLAGFDSAVTLAEPSRPGGLGSGFATSARSAVFNTFLQGPGITSDNSSVMIETSSSGPVLRARAGEPVNPSRPDTVFRQMFSPHVTPDGTIASLALSKVGSASQYGFWQSSGTGWAPAFEGPQGSLPGFPAGTGLILSPTYLDNVATNRAGQVAFSAFVTAGSGVWLSDGDSLRLIARNGQTAPGLVANSGAPAKFTKFFDSGISSVAIADIGVVAFRGYTDALVGTAFNAQGLWITNPAGDLRLVVAQGLPAPGLAGFNIFSGSPAQNHLVPVLSNLGQLAFLTQVISATSGLRTALYATDPAGFTHLIALTGQEFVVAPGDVRTISRIDLFSQDLSASRANSASDGNGMLFNDAGQLLFRLTFTNDSSGLFIASIPSPGLLSATLGLLALRRRRR